MLWDGRLPLIAHDWATAKGGYVMQLLAIDLGKRSFHLHGIDDDGVVVSRSVGRAKLEAMVEELAPSVIAMEACATAHHWARTFEAAGRTVRLINPKLWMEDQAVTGEISVKPTTENQALSGRLSNHLRARKEAFDGWCGDVFRSVKRNDPPPSTRRRAPFPGARA
jgi:hypothetical protein